MFRPSRETDNRLVVAALILGFVLSRILVRVWLGFSPDPSILENHWQHSDLLWLHDRFWETILYLHSQPPIWNAVIGAMTKLVGTDPARVAWAISFCYSIMSFLMMLFFVWFARRSGLSSRVSAVVGFLIAVSPTMIYYEYYPFYPHFTAFLVTGLFLTAVRMEDNTFWPVLLLFLISAVLSWTWGVFHPVFILLLGGLCLAMYPAVRSRAGLATILAALLVSHAPALKNDALFGQDFASSWLGINLTQTLPDRDQDLMSYCKFETVVDALVAGEGLSGVMPEPMGIVSVDAAVKPSSGEANMNNLLVSQRAAECFEIYLEEAPKDPVALLAHLGERLISSHGKPPFIYAFRPAGWDSRVLVDRIYYKFGALSEAACVLYYLVLIAYAVWRIGKCDDRRLYIFTLFIILYFTLVTHLANGIEQQRMRVTIAPLYWVLLIGLLSDIIAYLARKRSLA